MIIGIGETILDIIFKNDQPVKAVPGGSAFNAIVSIGRTETPCIMVTEVGDDHVGDIITTFLKDNGVQTDYVYRHIGTKSHVSLAFLNDRNDAEYSFYKHHEALSMQSSLPEVHKGDIILFGSFFAINPKIRDFVRSFLTSAREKGAILYYDINFRAPHVKDLPEVMPYIEENMRLATVVRGSSEDFEILYGLTDCDEVYNKHIKSLCPCFIYTDAAKPIKVRTPHVTTEYATTPIETVSTIGAGDNFNAGFCYALHRDCITDAAQLSTMSQKEWTPLIQQGQAFSAEVCQSFDNYISK